MTTTNPRHIPYGFKRSPVTGKPIKDKVEQRVITKIVEYRAEHMWPAMIARQLNDQGLRAKRGGKWTGPSVEKVLDRYDDDHPGDTDDAQEATGRDAELLVSIFPTEEYLCQDGVTKIQIPTGSADDLRRGKRVEFAGAGSYYDPWTGKLKQERSASYTEQDLMNIQAQEQAEARLTVAERAARIRFEDPGVTPTFGRCLHNYNIDKGAQDRAGEVMAHLNSIVDRIEGQKYVKGELRRELSAVFRELAAHRQFARHLLWRLEQAESQAQ